jgi:hypothetical protein
MTFDVLALLKRWRARRSGTVGHVYGHADDYHGFFGAGPVPGLLVDDFAGTVARLDAAGVEWLTEPDVRDGRTWRHYRAPDGNVYEVTGPAR